MKIIVVGASGTVGKQVTQEMRSGGHEVVQVGRKSGDFRVDMENRESVVRLYKELGSFDAVVSTAGEIAFTPLLSLTDEQWDAGFHSKLMGQIHLVQEAIPYIREGGSFTLISGILSDHFIQAGTLASTINRSVEGFVQAAACELPKGLRINVVSPTLLEDSVQAYGAFFPGFVPVNGKKVAQAFQRSVCGVETGRIYKVF